MRKQDPRDLYELTDDLPALEGPVLLQALDGYVDAGAALEWDVSAHWSLQASVGWRGATSNVPELAYGRLVGGLGLVWTRGLY